MPYELSVLYLFGLGGAMGLRLPSFLKGSDWSLVEDVFVVD